jgi:GNAT superfamily N-acetyltransferase
MPGWRSQAAPPTLSVSVPGADITREHHPLDEHFASERLRARTAGPSDEPLLQAVLVAAGDHFLGVTGRGEPDPDAARREIEAAGSTEGRIVVLLEPVEGGAPVGAAGWWTGVPDAETALLGMLLLVPQVRGQGLGREALEALARHLASGGIQRIRTGVGFGDQRARSLLPRLGFAPLDERSHVSVGQHARLMITFYERSTT